MDEVARKRADKAGDNRLWSPMDALEDVMASIKDKKPEDIEIAIHWFEVKPDGGRIHHYAAANLTYPDHFALLRVADHRLINEWTK